MIENHWLHSIPKTSVKGPCEPSKCFVSKSGERERQRETERDRERQREPERASESQRELERARESQREPKPEPGIPESDKN